MSVWAIVPVKPLSRAKSRLSGELLPEQREQLATELLARTVRLLVPLTQIRGVLVISRDTKALALVRELGANTVQESGAPELNMLMVSVSVQRSSCSRMTKFSASTSSTSPSERIIARAASKNS